MAGQVAVPVEAVLEEIPGDVASRLVDVRQRDEGLPEVSGRQPASLGP
jgi:hypothetical protein